MVLKNVISMFQYWRKGLLSTTSNITLIYEMRCAIWYHLYNLKNIKKDPREVLLLVTTHAFWIGGRSIVRFAEFYEKVSVRIFQKGLEIGSEWCFLGFIEKWCVKFLWFYAWSYSGKTSQRCLDVFGVNGAQNRFF